MKILKLPVDTKISCECGCEFEFEPEDVGVDLFYTESEEANKHYHVTCPFCKDTIMLYPDREKIKEDNKTLRHCVDCEYFQATAYRDEMTREWIQEFRCKQGRKPLGPDSPICDDFKEW